VIDIELRMTGSRVLVRTEDQKEHQNPSGVIVVESYAPEVIGEVISCGDCTEVNVGDIVLFAPQSGSVMELQGSRYLVLHEEEILAKWDEEQEPV
jgi:co-chaperonin GroES (HSP10)